MDNTEGDAVYPLSPLDNMLDRVIVVMGWLVEGTIDLEKLDGAMKTVVSKWPMLGGRFESTGVSTPRFRILSIVNSINNSEWPKYSVFSSSTSERISGRI